MTLTHRIATLATVAALTAGGAIALDTAEAPEANAGLPCYAGLTSTKARNLCTPKMRHWDAIRNAPSKYGAWVGKNSTSQQAACWTNIVSYGVTFA